MPMIATLKNNPWFWACMAVLSAIVANAFIQGCDRKGYNETLPPAETIRTQKRNILNTASLVSDAEARVRHVADSITTVKDKRYAALMKNYAALEAKSRKAKSSYQANPTLPKCDSLVNLQGQQIDSLQLANQIQREKSKQDSVKLASHARELESKNEAIGALSATVDSAVKELEQCEKKVKRRNTWLKISTGINAVLGIIVAAK